MSRFEPFWEFLYKPFFFRTLEWFLPLMLIVFALLTFIGGIVGIAVVATMVSNGR